MPDAVAFDEIATFGIPVGKFRQLLTTYEQLWNETKTLPTVESLTKKTGFTKKTVNKALGKPIWKELLTERGLPYSSITGLTPDQMMAIKVMTDPTDRRTPAQKLKAIGVPYARYRSWLRQPEFGGYINRITEDQLKDHGGDVMTALTNRAIEGDVGAIKYFFEVSGRYNPNKQAEVNLQHVMMVIFEVLTKHVQDQGTLAAIGAELQARIGKNEQQGLQPSPLETVSGQVVSRVGTEPDYNEVTVFSLGD